MDHPIWTISHGFVHIKPRVIYYDIQIYQNQYDHLEFRNIFEADSQLAYFCENF